MHEFCVGASVEGHSGCWGSTRPDFMGAFPPSDFNNMHMHAPRERAEPANPTSCVSVPHSPTNLAGKTPTTVKMQALAREPNEREWELLTTVAVMLAEFTA